MLLPASSSCHCTLCEPARASATRSRRSRKPPINALAASRSSSHGEYADGLWPWPHERNDRRRSRLAIRAPCCGRPLGRPAPRAEPLALGHGMPHPAACRAVGGFVFRKNNPMQSSISPAGPRVHAARFALRAAMSGAEGDADARVQEGPVRNGLGRERKPRIAGPPVDEPDRRHRRPPERHRPRCGGADGT